ncbi:hypothetical protein FI667_g7524, partial [Globisporangium splendens]
MEKSLSGTPREDLFDAASGEDDADLTGNADQPEPGHHDDNNDDNEDDGSDDAAPMEMTRDASASPPEWNNHETKVMGFTILLLEEFLYAGEADRILRESKQPTESQRWTLCAGIARRSRGGLRFAQKMGSLAKKSGMQLAATASIPAFSLMDADPYAFPPLFADDFYDLTSPGARGNGDDGPEEPRSGFICDSPAKAIVYANQTTEASHFMSTKEWEVINPQRSFIREAVEGTLRRVSSPVAAQRNSVFTPNEAI